MISSLLSVALLHAFAPALAAQDGQTEWVETRFHRVHLRNGNFIDGLLVKETDKSITLRLKAGDISLRSDLIDRVEIMKIRSINEKPPKVPPKAVGGRPDPTPLPPFPPPARPEEGRRPPQDGALDPWISSGFSKETVDRVNEIFDRFKKDLSETKFQILQEISSLGAEAAVFLATNLGALAEEPLGQIGAILARMKVAETRAPAAKALTHRNPQVRVQAVALLGELGSSASEKDLLPMLKDSDLMVRGQTLEALVKFGSRDALDPITKLCSDPDSAVRSKALAGLQRLLKALDQEREVLPRLSQALEDSKGAARVDVAAAIGKLGNPEAWGFLAPLLNDADPLIRQAAAAGLMTLQAPGSSEAILSRLPVETDKWTRVYLANAAQRTQTRKSVEIFITWMDDPDTDVRAAGHQALRNMTGQSIDQNRQKWEDWFRVEGGPFR